ncbi:MAG TPA: NAD(P)-dependent oxidoreductase [Chloroflexota bacterium]
MPKVFAFAPAGDSHKFLEASGCDVTIGKPEWHEPGGNYEPEVIGSAHGAAALVGTSMRVTPISERVLDAAPDLRIVAKTTIGVDDIDVDACTDRGILVTHAPVESNWGNIAEVTVTFLLALTKGLLLQDEHIKQGGWWPDASLGSYVGSRQSDGYDGITLGIIGLGRIGVRVAQLMRPWNINILACDPYIPEYRFLEAGAKPATLEEVLRQSDVVTVHVTLSKETRHLIGPKELSMMKPTAYFINTSRGEAVDEAALCEALDRGTIAGAALNAFEEEPIAPNSPLREMGNRVLLRPHGGTPVRTSGPNAPVGRSVSQATEWANDDVLKALRGELPAHVYNAEAVPRWLERFGGKSLLK